MKIRPLYDRVVVKRKEEEERQRRNEELLSGLSTEIAAFDTKLKTNADCLGPLAEEASMLVEQANMVIESQDAGMAPDIQQMLDEYYGPMVDEAIATQCGGGAAPAPEPEGTPEEAPTE